MRVRLLASTEHGFMPLVFFRWLLFCSVIPVEASCFLGAFSDSFSCNGRYFAQTGILPPLTTVTNAKRQHLHGFRNVTEFGTSQQQVSMPDIVSSGVQVTYTNNPKVVDEWLVENLSYDGSIIGFDVEVSAASCNATINNECHAEL